MMILDQCFSILDLVSLDWKSERKAIVAHSCRVMAKAKNFDEQIVGLMHEVYGGSSYARLLFSCDVTEASLWKPVLDLFAYPPFEVKKRVSEDVDDVDLLNINRPQNLKDNELEEWFLAKTRWSEAYRKYLIPIASNRIARNVMIYDLEDKLDILGNPGKYEKEYGPQYFALPWKKHYLVDIKRGRNCYISARIPQDDDSLLLRPLTDIERENLIAKYTRALEYLNMFVSADGLPYDFSPFELMMNAHNAKSMLEEWLIETYELEEYHEEGMEEYMDLPF